MQIKENTTNVESSTERPAFFRAREGVYKRVDSPWGTYYSKVPDPKGKDKPKYLDDLFINKDFSKLPAHLLQAVISLFRHYLKQDKGVVDCKTKFTESTTEVQVSLLRKEDNPDEWKVVVPKQEVGAVTVDAVHSECCDILTGEEYTVFPPIGWTYAGSMH